METQFEKSIDYSAYLAKTSILDFEHPEIKSLVERRGWQQLTGFDKIRAIYNFVKDEIKFGYNIDDAIPASRVLSDGYGQCNTKANLFMALLRAVGIPNRIHGFTIDKALQKGAITGIWYTLAPKNILHSWVEVFFEANWYNLEGLILDDAYLSALQRKFSECTTTFCGFGAYTDNFKNPQTDWNRNHTYIQQKGINQNFGLFNSPNEFYAKHEQMLNPLKKWIYQKYVRHRMNATIERIRSGGE